MSGHDYNFFISTDLDPGRVLEIMFKGLGIDDFKIETRNISGRPRPVCAYESDFEVLSPDASEEINVGLMAYRELQSDHYMLPELVEMLGIRDRHADYVVVHFFTPRRWFFEGQSLVTRAVGAILRGVEGDCIWVKDSQFIPALVRQDGRVTIDPSIWIWCDEDKQALGVSYTVGKLPSDPNM